MARACSACGTEVDDDALFCPTCGQPIERGEDPQLPPAPDWPEPGTLSAAGTAAKTVEPPPGNADAGSPPVAETDRLAEPGSGPGAPREGEPDESAYPVYQHPAANGGAVVPPADRRAAAPAAGPAAPADEPVPPWRRGAAFRAAHPSDVGRSSADEEAPGVAVAREPVGPLRPEPILSVPETLSGWLVGAGAFVGIVAMFVPWTLSGSFTGGWGLASGINILFTVVLLGVLAVIFIASVIPPIPARDLVMLCIGLIGVGIGLDRLGLPLTGAGGVIFLIAMLAVSSGALLAQIGMDRVIGRPRGSAS